MGKIPLILISTLACSAACRAEGLRLCGHYSPGAIKPARSDDLYAFVRGIQPDCLVNAASATDAGTATRRSRPSRPPRSVLSSRSRRA